MRPSRKPPMRQFCCETCSRRWWKSVPKNDLVSVCTRCHEESGALPLKMESGWAKYECKCGNNFSGFATLINPADSPCYKCRDYCAPVKVIRLAKDIRKRPRHKDNRHSCTGVNCYNSVQGIPAKGDCVHPKSNPQVNCEE